MATNPVKRKWTVEEYLTLEAQTGIKYEYIKGELHPLMSRHDIIVMNILRSLRLESRQSPDCYIYNGEMRLKIDEKTYLYADASAVYGKPNFADEGETTITNPTMVLEVMSPETLGRDLGKKYHAYLHHPSVKAYLMLYDDEVFATLYTPDGTGWLLRDYKSLEDVIPLEAIGCKLALSEAYLNVEFDGEA